MKYIRGIIGAIFVLTGFILTILPGSFLLVLVGLVLISMDYAPARQFLALLQKGMSANARKLDRVLHKRKYR